MRVRICPWCGHHNPEEVWWCTCGGTLSVDTIADVPDEDIANKERARQESSAQPAESQRRQGIAPQEPKGRFCTQCGSELEDSHKFCSNCGHPRTGAAPVEEPVWETCVILAEVAAEAKFPIHGGQARWWAKATGPQRTYRAGESPVWHTRVKRGTFEIPEDSEFTHWGYLEALQALNELASQLVADGWEPAGTYGGSYWTRQYRRHIG